MATVYKRRELRPIPEGAEIITYRGKLCAKWTDSKGKARRAPLNAAGDKIIQYAEHYTAQYFDHNGKRRKAATGCHDKATAQQVADRLQSETALRKRGIVNTTQERYAAEARRHLTEHLEDFVQDLHAKGRTERHILATRRHIETIAEDCNAETIDGLTGAAVQVAIGVLRDAGKSLRTCNSYLTSIKALTRWLRKERRAPDDPLTGLSKYNEETDRRHIRREMTPDELVQLLIFTEGYTTANHNLCGPDRAMVYRVATGTGFRAEELRSLTPQSFDLDSDPPTVTAEASYSKRRRKDVQPIRRDLAEMLRTWLKGRPAGERIFGNMPGGTARMLRSDLRVARKKWIEAAKTVEEREERQQSDFLQYEDSAGRVIDFHATRHTYISGIVAGGASVKTAQELARHSTPVLTIGRYSHARLHDLQGALDTLPDLQPQTESEDPDRQTQRATGTDGQTAEGVRGQMRGQYRRKTLRETAKNDQTEGQSEGGAEEPKTVVFPGKTLENQGKTARGAGRIRTGDGGFAILCLSHLATAPTTLET